MTAIEAVGHVPGGQQEKQPGQKERQARVSKIERAMGDGVDLPRDRDRLRLRAKDRTATRAS